jgi:hypothetical protein
MAIQISTHMAASLVTLETTVGGYVPRENLIPQMVTDNPKVTITGITQANPGEVTAAAHGMETGDFAWIEGVVGMVEVNGAWFSVTKTHADTFTLGVDTTGYTAYTSGGTCQLYRADVTCLRRVKDYAKALLTAGTWKRGFSRSMHWPSYKTV